MGCNPGSIAVCNLVETPEALYRFRPSLSLLLFDTLLYLATCRSPYLDLQPAPLMVLSLSPLRLGKVMRCFGGVVLVCFCMRLGDQLHQEGTIYITRNIPNVVNIQVCVNHRLSWPDLSHVRIGRRMRIISFRWRASSDCTAKSPLCRNNIDRTKASLYEYGYV